MRTTKGLAMGIPLATFVGMYGLGTLIKEKTKYHVSAAQLEEYFPYVPAFNELARMSSSMLEKMVY